MDNGWNSLHTASYTIDQSVRYSVKIEATGSTYNVYVDDNQVFSNIAQTDYTTGSIGLRTFQAPAKFYSVTLEELAGMDMLLFSHDILNTSIFTKLQKNFCRFFNFYFNFYFYIYFYFCLLIFPPTDLFRSHTISN